MITSIHTGNSLEFIERCFRCWWSFSYDVIEARRMIMYVNYFVGDFYVITALTLTVIMKPMKIIWITHRLHFIVYINNRTWIQQTDANPHPVTEQKLREFEYIIEMWYMHVVGIYTLDSLVIMTYWSNLASDISIMSSLLGTMPLLQPLRTISSL